MGEVSRVEVPGGENDGFACREGDGERPQRRVDLTDRPAPAVANVESPIVAKGHHLVACLEGDTVDQQLRPVEATVRLDAGAGPPVQVGDVRPAASEHDHVLACDACRPPVGDETGTCVLSVVTDGDAAVVSVRTERDVEIPVAEVAQRLALPSVALAAVLGQRDARQSLRQGGQQTAGIDLGQLAGVADEDDLGAGLRRRDR